MKKTIVFLLFVCAAAVADGQNIRDFKRRLAEPAITSEGRVARVQVVESGEAAEAVRRGDAVSQQQRTVNGYRVVIFFDNGATARAEAERVMREFGERYHDVKCDIRYENPYFKVLAGHCATSEDAAILLGRIHRDYPEAYVMREEIAVKSLVERPAHHASEAEEDARER